MSIVTHPVENESAKPGLPTVTRKDVLEHMASANVPTLLMVLLHLTGDSKWMSDPYRPARNRGLTDDASGGFSTELQDEIRTAAADAFMEWRAGKAPAMKEPGDSLMLDMMSWAVAEEVPAEYGPMIAEQLGFTRRSDKAVADHGRPKTAIIVGAGVSGLYAAQQLIQEGMDCLVLERRSSVGGVWYENKYPGAGVDTPNHVYSYPSFPRDWSHHYSMRDDILEYLRDFARENELESVVRLRSTVTAAEYDSNRQQWIVSYTRDGEQLTEAADIFVSASGIFSEPKIPAIPGLEDFQGKWCHSARWDDSIDLEGKRVVVLGAGSTASQICSAIAPIVGEMHVFQRTPHWIAPAPGYGQAVDDDSRWLYSNFPYYREWYRFRMSWLYYDKLFPSLIIDPEWDKPALSINERNHRHRAFLERYASEQLDGDEELLAKVIPSYPPYSKRMVVDSGWFKALKQDNVHLHTESPTAFTASGPVKQSGEQIEADVVIFATGFKTTDYLSSFEVTGRDGVDLHGKWNSADGARAYIGMAVPEFPNFFIFYGPNINGAGGSYTGVVDSQVSFVVSLLREMWRTGAGAVEVKESAYTTYNEEIDRRLSSMIWSHPGALSWMRDESGRIVTSRPWNVVEFWHLLESADPSQFTFEPSAHLQAVGAMASAAYTNDRADPSSPIESR